MIERKHFIDYLKATGMFLVVFGHFELHNPQILKVIFGFHMPLFFGISGFLLSKKSVLAPWAATFKKYGSAYLRPYFFFATIGYTLWIVASQLDSEAVQSAQLHEPIIGTLYGTGTPMEYRVKPVVLWFFPCLFSSMVIATSILRIFSRNPLAIAMTIALPGLFWPQKIVLPFEIETALVAQLYIVIGHQTRARNLEKKIKNQSNLIRYMTSILLLSVGIYFGILNDISDMRSSEYGNPILWIISSITMTCGLGLLFLRLPEHRAVTTISQATIIIFPLHLIVLDIISLLYRTIGIKDTWIVSSDFGSLIQAILICYSLAFFWIFLCKLKRKYQRLQQLKKIHRISN